MNINYDSHEIKKIVGYLPESNPLYMEMFVYDLLKFTANTRGIFGNDFKSALDRVVEQCGLKEVVHKKVGECSKGYKQRVGLACAMIHNPKILILDEPVTGLDPNQIIEIRKLIKKLGKEKLVLMSSHILQEIEATVDRIIIIDKGKIVADGTTKKLMNDFGIFSGISCGAVVRAAAMLAERIDSGNIVLILADGGWKYLSTQLWTKDYSEIEENVKDVLWW